MMTRVIGGVLVESGKKKPQQRTRQNKSKFARKRELRQLLAQYNNEYGFPPSLEELGQLAKPTLSKSVVSGYLSEMENEGMVYRLTKGNRSYVPDPNWKDPMKESPNGQ